MPAGQVEGVIKLTPLAKVDSLRIIYMNVIFLNKMPLGGLKAQPVSQR